MHSMMMMMMMKAVAAAAICLGKCVGLSLSISEWMVMLQWTIVSTVAYLFKFEYTHTHTHSKGSSYILSIIYPLISTFSIHYYVVYLSRVPKSMTNKNLLNEFTLHAIRKRNFIKMVVCAYSQSNLSHLFTMGINFSIQYYSTTPIYIKGKLKLLYLYTRFEVYSKIRLL